jgi:hypothetical protein
MRFLAFWAAAVLSLPLAPTVGRAECAEPRPVILPPDGALLPPKAALYVFMPRLVDRDQ